MIQPDGEIYHVLGLEESACDNDPKQSRDREDGRETQEGRDMGIYLYE